MEPPAFLYDRSRTPSKIYRREELLGKGSFARVYLVSSRISDDKLAVKTIYRDLFTTNKKRNLMKKVEGEIEVHRRLSELGHKNIIKFYNSFETPNHVFIVLEWAELKTLKEVSIKRQTVTEAETRYYFTQVAAGLKFLGDQKILHRDIKLGNLFLSADMTVKIGDFGLAIALDEDGASELCGTPNYISPEVLAGLSHSLQSDLWALGCVIYALLCGNPPFHSESVQKTYELIRSLKLQIPPGLSVTAAKFLKKMLDEKPLNRGNLSPPGTPDSLLGHPFLSQGFRPATLPPSALSEEPHWDQAQLGQGTVSPPPAPVSNTFLERVEKNLKSVLKRKDQAREGEELVDQRKVAVFISRWAEYSDRLGFVFQLSNGGSGVLYTDGGKLGVSPDGKIVEFADLDGDYFYCSVEDLKKHQDMKFKYDNLKVCLRFLSEKLHETILSDPTVSRVTAGQSTKLPQLIRRLRTEDVIILELNNNSVQVNFLKNHKKVIIWTEDDGNMFATLIFPVGSETGAQTLSLGPDCSSQEMTEETRRVLRQTRRKIKEFHQ